MASGGTPSLAMGAKASDSSPLSWHHRLMRGPEGREEGKRGG
jgi:hypothetical protein